MYKPLRIVLNKKIKCIKCKKKFKRKSPNQKFCGFIKKKGTCSFINKKKKSGKYFRKEKMKKYHCILPKVILKRGKCSICLKLKKLVIDHCHFSNKFRGFICHKCNSALGFFGDNIKILKNAIKYLTKIPPNFK